MRNRTKEDEKKYAVQHQNVVGVEERCRNMNEIIKFRAAEQKKGEKVEVSEDDIRELEEQYESMIYEKEENQIQ